jgi:hypothetical protein
VSGAVAASASSVATRLTSGSTSPALVSYPFDLVDGLAARGPDEANPAFLDDRVRRHLACVDEVRVAACPGLHDVVAQRLEHLLNGSGTAGRLQGLGREPPLRGGHESDPVSGGHQFR